MKAMKFDTGSDENLSRKIQERLFEMGYAWLSGKDFKHTEKPYLYTNSNGIMGHGEFETFFNKNPNQLTTYEDIRKPQRGERVLVWDDNENQAYEIIFLTEIEGAIYPIQVVHPDYEEEFLNGVPFGIVAYKHMKPLNDKLSDVIYKLSEIKRKHKELGDEIEKMKRGGL